MVCISIAAHHISGTPALHCLVHCHGLVADCRSDSGFLPLFGAVWQVCHCSWHPSTFPTSLLLCLNPLDLFSPHLVQTLHTANLSNPGARLAGPAGPSSCRRPQAGLCGSHCESKFDFPNFPRPKFLSTSCCVAVFPNLENPPFSSALPPQCLLYGN